ncbi:hypothetical protein PR048_031716 [Dryococelus australis]|uniref:Uncharacterized protein n=1 Tax=Dryococelus australis TaxID=614101 RepID=A0ABQ9G623_9NEOP|nr:hypothetical protein PR048_031716 [Dryococelus australis]
MVGGEQCNLSAAVALDGYGNFAYGAAPDYKRKRKRAITEKTRRPAASSCTITSCGNPRATLPGIERRSLNDIRFGRLLTARSLEPMRVTDGQGKQEIPEKIRRPAASFGTIPTCKNPVTRPGIEPGSPWWETSVPSAQPPWPQNARLGKGCRRRSKEGIRAKAKYPPLTAQLERARTYNDTLKLVPGD